MKETWNSDDEVDLVVVTHHNFLPAARVSLETANGLIQQWYGARERVRRGECGKETEQGACSRAKGHEEKCEHMEGAQDALSMCTKGTFALNHKYDDCDEHFGFFAVGWEHVIGMYIRKVKSLPGDEWKQQDE